MDCREFEQSKEYVGLQDGGHNYLTCSNCKKKLVDLWVTNAGLDRSFKYRANCPYCGDKSFEKTIKGGVAVAGIYKEIDEDNDVALTLVENFDIIGDTIEYKVIKNGR